jgi:hypothetical protein
LRRWGDSHHGLSGEGERERGMASWVCWSGQVRPDLSLEWVSENEDGILNKLNGGVDLFEVWQQDSADFRQEGDDLG